MTNPTTQDRLRSPFHTGEQAVQERLGVREHIERFGRRVIRNHMPEQHREFYAQLPFVLVGHADHRGAPWASILFNEPGFISTDGPDTLQINALPVPGDPLGNSMTSGTRLGLLGIELATRRRNRLSAHILDSNSDSFGLKIDQSFGNCPQYIQTRTLERIDTADMTAASVEEITELDELTRGFIEQSDTFFVASAVSNGSGDASEGADVSHRGGKPGFVRVDDSTTLTIPDYSGNNHFNTLGNFVKNPRAGLLFLDFETGHLLTLTGTVDILWDAPQAQFFNGAQRLWKFNLDRGRWLRNALPLRWTLEDYSPNTLLSGTWDEAKKAKQAHTRKTQWSDYEVMDVEQESSVIRSVYLKPREYPLPQFAAGQFLTLKTCIAEREVIRTYTVSSAPADAALRISVKLEKSSGDDAPDGCFSTFIHKELKPGDLVQARAPSGSFTFDASERRPAVLLSAGIGITPMVAMARHALNEGLRTRHTRATTIISAAATAEQRAFFAELNTIAARSAGKITSYWSLSQTNDSLKPGSDYHQKGRISSKFLQSVLPMDDYDFYLCGPAPFMQSMYNTLRELGVCNGRIFSEEFGPASLVREPDQGDTSIAMAATASRAIVEFTESGTEQAWSQGDGTLLEFAESHGFSPEFGCRNGQCGRCKATLVAGKITYQAPPPTGTRADEALLCCARPAQVEEEELPRVSIRL